MGKLLPFFRQQFLDNDGKPLAGGLLYTYIAGTTTPIATYTDQSETTENTNPIVLDAAGCASIWMGDAFLKLILHDADDVFVDMRDNVSSGGSGGGGALPPGGAVGDALEKLSSGDGNAVWKSFNYEGVSSRFGAWVSNGLKETIDKLISITYTPPQVSLSASGAGTLRERGDAVSSTTLTATVTKRSDPIASVVFKKDGVVIHTVASPNPNGGTESYTWTGTPFSNNSTFTVEVTDNGATGGPSTVTGSATFSFVYPYYHGAGAPALTASQVAALTKSIIANTATLARTFTAANGNVFYFAYPASYGALTSILDVNNFETFPDWTLRTENITGLDGNAVSYRIYVFKNPVVAGSYAYTFKR